MTLQNLDLDIRYGDFSYAYRTSHMTANDMLWQLQHVVFLNNSYNLKGHIIVKVRMTYSPFSERYSIEGPRTKP